MTGLPPRCARSTRARKQVALLRQMLLEDKCCVVTGAASKRGSAWLRPSCSPAKAHAWPFSTSMPSRRKPRRPRWATAHRPRLQRHRPAAVQIGDRRGSRRRSDMIDVLVNNAGITQPLKFMEIKPENYEAVTDVSLRGSLYMSQAVVPHMRERKSGSIICLSSVSAQRGGGVFGGPHYSAAKAGVLGLAKAMARELGPDGPGEFDHPGTDPDGHHRRQADRRHEAGDLKGILSRLGEAKDVAGACLFLASDLSSYITGAVIDVNGGMLIH